MSNFFIKFISNRLSKSKRLSKGTSVQMGEKSSIYSFFLVWFSLKISSLHQSLYEALKREIHQKLMNNVIIKKEEKYLTKMKNKFNDFIEFFIFFITFVLNYPIFYYNSDIPCHVEVRSNKCYENSLFPYIYVSDFCST